MGRARCAFPHPTIADTTTVEPTTTDLPTTDTTTTHPTTPHPTTTHPTTADTTTAEPTTTAGCGDCNLGNCMESSLPHLDGAAIIRMLYHYYYIQLKRESVAPDKISSILNHTCDFRRV